MKVFWKLARRAILYLFGPFDHVIFVLLFLTFFSSSKDKSDIYSHVRRLRNTSILNYFSFIWT